MNKPISATNQPEPGHIEIEFPGIRFFSDFDSGNLQQVAQINENTFHLWTAPDCFQTQCENSCRTWFCFGVETQTTETLMFTVKNLNSQGKLFREGMKIVYNKGNGWQRFDTPLQWIQGEGSNMFELSFTHKFDAQSTYFAYTFPWTYFENLNFIQQCQSSSPDWVYFNKETLIRTLENRLCELLTISSTKGMLPEREPIVPCLFPDMQPRPFKFSQDKQVIIISARVHPGEVQSSYVLNGFLKFILSDDQRAKSLLDNFVFKIIPMLNPDGVFRGYYRTDTNGINLNRVYNDPIRNLHPTIFGVVEYTKYLSLENKVFCYIDLHGHATKRGCFVYGNYFNSFSKQIESCIFPKLMSLNCVNFTFDGSSFTERNGSAGDRREGVSKEGCGRVQIYRITNQLACYTLECNYHSGTVYNDIVNNQIDTGDVFNRRSRFYRQSNFGYTIEVFENVGQAMGVSFLDWIGLNQFSRAKMTGLQSLMDIKLEAAKLAAQQVPYRFDATIRNLIKNKLELQTYIENNQNLLSPVKYKPQLSRKRPPRPNQKPQINRKAQQYNISQQSTDSDSAKDLQKLPSVHNPPPLHRGRLRSIQRWPQTKFRTKSPFHLNRSLSWRPDNPRSASLEKISKFNRLLGCIEE